MPGRGVLSPITVVITAERPLDAAQLTAVDSFARDVSNDAEVASITYLPALLRVQPLHLDAAGVAILTATDPAATEIVGRDRDATIVSIAPHHRVDSTEARALFKRIQLDGRATLAVLRARRVIPSPAVRVVEFGTTRSVPRFGRGSRSWPAPQIGRCARPTRAEIADQSMLGDPHDALSLRSEPWITICTWGQNREGDCEPRHDNAERLRADQCRRHRRVRRVGRR